MDIHFVLQKGSMDMDSLGRSGRSIVVREESGNFFLLKVREKAETAVKVFCYSCRISRMFLTNIIFFVAVITNNVNKESTNAYARIHGDVMHNLYL